jgi:prefoldin subunit 5
MSLDEKIEGLVKQFNENNEEIDKLQTALKERENLKLEITGALKAFNSLKEEESKEEEPKKTKKASKK